MWMPWARDPSEPHATATCGGGGRGLRMKGPLVGDAGDELRLLRPRKKAGVTCWGQGPQTGAAGWAVAPDAALHLPEYRF